MLVVPVKSVPNQQVQVQLGGQAVTLNIYQQIYGLYMDVYVGNTLIIAGVICQNLNRIVRDAYFGFVGDFAWFDITTDANGNGADPLYTGLGAQFQLVYLEETDLPAGEG